MSSNSFQGVPIAPGFIVGPLCVLARVSEYVHASNPSIEDPSVEVERFRRQVDALEEEIEDAINRLMADSFLGEAEILRAHLVMLKDPDLHDQVLGLIRDTCVLAESAVEQVLEKIAGILASAADPILAERATDFRDLGMRLTSRLSNQTLFDLGRLADDSQKAVLAVHELLPSLVLEARDHAVAGFIVESGTSLSHGAILAKSFSMPVVRLANLDSIRLYAGWPVLVACDGDILIDPTDAELRARRPKDDATVTVPCIPLAGAPRARVWTSIVDPDQLEAVDWAEIEGVGLYRSETLFLRYRDDFPSEREQFLAYRRLFELAGAKPVVFRTVDLGADKPVEHMRFGPQDNPYLGLRAHRLFRYHPGILITQIRAVLRAAEGEHRLRLMFPMLESIDQLRFVRGLVDQATRSLEDEGLPFQRSYLLGVLVETPSAAWSFERLLEEVDFASVGTNDLVQYLFAVERNAANVADLYQPAHPVVLQVIQALAQHASNAGKPFGICGEVAADEVMLPVLVGLGLRDFSVAPGTAYSVKRRLQMLSEEECERLARACLAAYTGDEVLSLIGQDAGSSTNAQPAHRKEAVDPVCGMLVRIDDTPYVLRKKGPSRYFCSRHCLNQFTDGAGGESAR
ncbi:MAG TPA: phosphoenolpyruvate--protein phosphotransferase [Candidatus Competibacteraceae bacterium]|nr:phosphoenolpyruvate--protein phosphotransferase [Candidatus Competibacteraceae bacterium]HRX71098.1 phosphoenolpyruvate--protein phosphotransferase [Candidatus Competibacteraceae bacterium]